MQNTSNDVKQNVSLDAPGVAKALAARIAEDIADYCIETYDGGHRWHLGASQIGDECKRKLWYIFRWCFHDKMEKENNSQIENKLNRGRMQRLFQRGHKEEDRFIEYLEGIGIQVWADDLENNKLILKDDGTYELIPTSELPNIKLSSVDVSDEKFHIKRAKADGLEFPQYKIKAVNGHFGGSLDGIAILPERYGIVEPILLEFKTNGTGQGFNKLVKDGMIVSKPQHFAQTSTYGGEYKFNYVLYLNTNKNDDTLHIEIAKLDHNQGEQMKLKAEQIILANKPPARISDNPTFLTCKWCAASNICHKGDIPEVNCRSCANATPVENAEWYCQVHNGIIPRDYVAQGCGTHYKAVTQNV